MSSLALLSGEFVSTVLATFNIQISRIILQISFLISSPWPWYHHSQVAGTARRSVLLSELLYSAAGLVTFLHDRCHLHSCLFDNEHLQLSTLALCITESIFFITLIIVHNIINLRTIAETKQSSSSASCSMNTFHHCSQSPNQTPLRIIAGAHPHLQERQYSAIEQLLSVIDMVEVTASMMLPC